MVAADQWRDFGVAAWADAGYVVVGPMEAFAAMTPTEAREWNFHYQRAIRDAERQQRAEVESFAWLNTGEDKPC